MQLSLFPEVQKAQRRADIDRALDKIRGKYGYHSIRRAITLVDPTLDLDAKGEHIIHPIGFSNMVLPEQLHGCLPDVQCVRCGAIQLGLPVIGQQSVVPDTHRYCGTQRSLPRRTIGIRLGDFL